VIVHPGQVRGGSLIKETFYTTLPNVSGRYVEKYGRCRAFRNPGHARMGI